MTNKKNILVSALMVPLSIAFGILYRVSPLHIFMLGILSILSVPIVVKAHESLIKESKKFKLVSDYLIQMSSSFLKSEKILESLKDTYFVTAKSKMKKSIGEAIEYLENGISEAEDKTIWEEAFFKIEKDYGCRRMRELHKFLISVEVEGSKDYKGALGLLIKDNNAWIDRTIIYQKKKSEIKIHYAVGVVLAALVCTLSLFFGKYVDITKNPLYSLVSLIFLLACVFSYVLLQASFKSSWLDMEKNEKQILRDYDFVMDSIKRNKKSSLKYKAAFARCVKEIKLEFPEWIRGIVVEKSHNTVQMCLQNSYSSSPIILKKAIYELLKGIEEDSEAIEPYDAFLKEFDIAEVTSAMKLLYSISELGNEESKEQLTTLMERNYMLLDNATKGANESVISSLKQIIAFPLYFATVKTVVDLSLFVSIFLNGIGSADMISKF